ncbi:hypothetical protein BVX98_06965 [bacterium F11]|nr:hypothetical protein BVX98_06965 [bacterium F11]
MKKILITLGAVVLFNGSVIFAHCGQCAVSEKSDSKINNEINRKVQKMSKDLDLTAKQQKEISAAMQTKQDKSQAIWSKRHDEMSQVAEEYKAQMKSILSAEQYKKYEKSWGMKMKKEGKKHKKESY